MKRELAGLIEDLHDGLLASAIRAHGPAGLRLAEVEMRLPLDITPVFADGGCRLLADVARNHTDADWQHERSQLYLRWQAIPLAAAESTVAEPAA